MRRPCKRPGAPLADAPDSSFAASRNANSKRRTSWKSTRTRSKLCSSALSSCIATSNERSIGRTRLSRRSSPCRAVSMGSWPSPRRNPRDAPKAHFPIEPNTALVISGNLFDLVLAQPGARQAEVDPLIGDDGMKPPQKPAGVASERNRRCQRQPSHAAARLARTGFSGAKVSGQRSGRSWWQLTRFPACAVARSSGMHHSAGISWPLRRHSLIDVWRRPTTSPTAA